LLVKARANVNPPKRALLADHKARGLRDSVPGRLSGYL